MKIFFCAVFIFCGIQGWAEDFSSGPILDGSTLMPVELSKLIQVVQPGSVVILSEIHTLKSHHQNQMNFINELEKISDSKISIGFEMFDINEQNLLDDYSDKLISAEQLKSYVSLSKDWFDFYLPLLKFTQNPESQAVALNAPKWLTSKIARVGIDQLSNYEKLLIPTDFALGDEMYLERFQEVSHIPKDKIKNYFEAQCMWDDIMADTAREFILSNPKGILVIIVGDFHAAYYGGLPKRLRQRGVANIVTISQVSTAGLNEKEKDELIKPHSRYGRRADYIWVSEEPEAP